MRDRPDFPFYNGQPSPLTPRGCLMVLAACAISFATLLWIPKVWPGTPGSWLATLLFVFIQLAGLALAVGPAWKTLFRRPTRRDVLIAIAYVPLACGLPALLALVFAQSLGAVGNPEIENIAALPPLGVINVFAMTAVQLLGEELITILPFLVLMTLFHRTGMKRWQAIALSLFITSLAFGALHLSTYQWHVAQVLIFIGLARVVLTGVYLVTKNLWASTITHILNDWSMLALAVLVHALH